MRFSIKSVDYAPEELYDQVPIGGKVLRRIPGPDRPDYFLAVLDKPILSKRDGTDTSISHLVLAARWVGGVFHPNMRDTPVNIAYVLDPSLLEDPSLDFDKSHYAAIGVADGEGSPSMVGKLVSWFKQWKKPTRVPGSS